MARSGLTSSVEDAFDATHQALMDSVGRPARAGVRAQRHASTARLLRRERIDSLRGLLHTMAEALDIRHVFPRCRTSFAAGCRTTSWRSPRGQRRRFVPPLRRGRRRRPTPSFSGPRLLTGDDRTRSTATPTSSTTPTPSSCQTAFAAASSALRRPLRAARADAARQRTCSARSSSCRATRLASPKTTSTSRAESRTTSRSRCRTSGWRKRRGAMPRRARRRRGSKRRSPR